MKKYLIGFLAASAVLLPSCTKKDDQPVGFIVGAIKYELSEDRQRLTVTDGDVVRVYCREKTEGTNIYFGPCPLA